MAAWGYEFYLLVLKVSLSFSALTRERYFQHSKIKFVSPSGHVISSISIVLYVNLLKKAEITQSLEISCQLQLWPFCFLLIIQNISA